MIYLKHKGNITPTLPVISRYILDDDFIPYNGGINHLFNISSNGNSSITSYGFVCNTIGNATISDFKYEISTNNFVGLVNNTYFYNNFNTQLSSYITYYIRPYCTNNVGTVYGDERIFVTGTQSATNSYSSVILYPSELIGCQLWIKNNWTSIKDSTGLTLTYTNNNTSNNPFGYGYLYDSNSVLLNNNIIPTGWKLPTMNDANILINYLNDNGDVLKQIGNNYWDINIYANNNNKFYGRGAGYFRLFGLSLKSTLNIILTTVDYFLNLTSTFRSINIVTITDSGIFYE